MLTIHHIRHLDREVEAYARLSPATRARLDSEGQHELGRLIAKFAEEILGGIERDGRRQNCVVLPSYGTCGGTVTVLWPGTCKASVRNRWEKVIRRYGKQTERLLSALCGSKITIVAAYPELVEIEDYPYLHVGQT
jgi:hypothetical protein